MAKTYGKPFRGAWGKMIIAILGTVFFTVAACILAFHALQSQQSGIPISNGQAA